MITNLIISVQDTESSKFEFSGTLTRESYESMVLDHFHKTNNQIDEFMHRDRGSNFAYNLPENGEYYEGEDTDNEVEVQALLLDSNKRNFDEDYLFDMVDQEKMFILNVNVNPEELDDDAESEIKYWLEDSSRVFNDDDLDKRTKLEALPTRNLKIVLSDGNKYTLQNCKIFEDYSDEKYPIYFAMIVEKITL